MPSRLDSVRLGAMLVAAALAAFAFVSAPASAIPWSAPQDLGPASDYVNPSGLAALPSGETVMAWTRRVLPAGSGGLSGFSVKAHPADNDGERGVIGVFRSGGSAGVAGQRVWSLAAGPVAGKGAQALALVSRVVGGDDDGNRYVRLSLIRIGAGGRVLSVKRLVKRAIVRSVDITSNGHGSAIAAWVQARPFAGSTGPKLSAHEFQELQALRVAAIGPRGRAGKIRTLERTWDDTTDYGGQVITAVGRDGRALVGLVSAHGGRRHSTVDAFVRRAHHPFSAAARVGPELGFGDLAAAFTPSGAAVLAWGTQDGGEEAGNPWIVRAVTIALGLRRWTSPQILDPGGPKERPLGGLAAVGLPDDRFAVAWSAVDRSGYPVKASISGRGGHFGPAAVIAPDGAVGSIVAAPDGRLLVTWATNRDYSKPGEPPPTQAFAAMLNPGATTFGAAEPLADPDDADPPLATFLPDGRAIAIWDSDADGHDPSRGAVLRVAVRN